jgi:hypothetical protein
MEGNISTGSGITWYLRKTVMQWVSNISSGSKITWYNGRRTLLQWVRNISTGSGITRYLRRTLLHWVRNISTGSRVTWYLRRTPLQSVRWYVCGLICGCTQSCVRVCVWLLMQNCPYAVTMSSLHTPMFLQEVNLKDHFSLAGLRMSEWLRVFRVILLGGILCPMLVSLNTTKKP